MSGKLIVTLSDGNTEEHFIDRPDLGGTAGDYAYSVRDGVLIVRKGYEGTTSYPLTSIIRWDVRR